MRVEISLDTGMALPIANALRHIALSRLPAWRPVAFSLNRDFNILHASSDIVEDTFTVISNLSELNFYPIKEIKGNFVKERYVFTGSLRTSQIVSEHFDVVGQDMVLLSSLSDLEVELTVIYRYSHGTLTTNDNLEFLKENQERDSKYILLASRHTNVSNFSFDIEKQSLDKEKLILTIESEGVEESEVLKDSLNALRLAVVQLENIVLAEDPKYFTKV